MTSVQADEAAEDAGAAGALHGIVASAMLIHGVSALVELGAVERLADGPRTAEELAEDAGAEAGRLRVVLRAGAAAGLVAEEPPGTYRLTAAGSVLRADHPRGLSDLFRWCTYGDFFRAWTRLGDAVRSDRSAFELTTGQELFGYLDDHPEPAAVFHRAMNASAPGAALLQGIDIPADAAIADLGGGDGAALTGLLRDRPAARGILFDLPSAVEGAAPVLHDAGVADRCTVVGGSFFDAVPAGADVYLMVRVLQNWPDRSAAEILRTVRAAMEPSSRLLIAGHLPDRAAPDPYLEAMGLSMFVLYGAPLRSAEEYAPLFASAGLALHSVHPVREAEAVMDVRPV